MGPHRPGHNRSWAHNHRSAHSRRRARWHNSARNHRLARNHTSVRSHRPARSSQPWHDGDRTDRLRQRCRNTTTQRLKDRRGRTHDSWVSLLDTRLGRVHRIRCPAAKRRRRPQLPSTMAHAKLKSKFSGGFYSTTGVAREFFAAFTTPKPTCPESNPHVIFREGCPCPESRRSWPAKPWMAERRQLRTSEGLEGRSECPATGHGQPRPTPDVGEPLSEPNP